MSEIRYTASSKAQEITPLQDEPLFNRSAQAPARARHDFDAAIRRASDQEGPEKDDPEASEQAPVDVSQSSPGHLPYFLLSHGHGAQASLIDSAGLGGSPAVALPTLPSSPLPDAMPTATLANATGVGSSLRLQVPLGGAEAATLALRLAQTGAGQWQLRVGGDASTRQQLAPHLERLRDRLRGRGAGVLDELGFDDDTES